MKKNWTPILAFLISAGAYGNSIEVYQGPLHGTESDTLLTARFRANADEPGLGRAWVEVSSRKETFEGENRVTELSHRVKIDGLTFDPETNRILYSKDGRTEICASGTASSPSQPEAGCQLVTRIERQLVDDGYYRRHRYHGIVTLKLADTPTKSLSSER